MRRTERRQQAAATGIVHIDPPNPLRPRTRSCIRAAEASVLRGKCATRVHGVRLLDGITFRPSKLRYSNRYSVRESPSRARERVAKAAPSGRGEASPRLAAGRESGGREGRGPAAEEAGGGARPGYGYEALSAASDGSDAELDEAPEYTAFDMDMSGGAESVDGPSSRGSAKVNFPPDVGQERRATVATAATAPRRSRGRSMSAWSDISRSSIRFEERQVPFYLYILFVCIRRQIAIHLHI
ncbi:hypothetical protein RR48_15449 [Papilio machaon]|uniref:Uncharacterized protein n=1 Tax=Papilio machaon TaxID=76193 RepID=A0A194QUV0_PAPMA|nr:hypothetical protein RR48_15449 [Papilio machaon]